MGKAEAVHANRAKEGIHSHLIRGQTFSLFQKDRA